MNQSIRTYRNSVTAGATHLDLLLATYDALADDLRLAGAAVQRRDIAGRCAHSQHAAALLGHLESWIPLLGEPTLEHSLTQFYAHLRAELLKLQASTDPTAFTALALEVGSTRAAWQSRQQSAPTYAPAPVPASQTTYSAGQSWSA